VRPRIHFPSRLPRLNAGVTPATISHWLAVVRANDVLPPFGRRLAVVFVVLSVFALGAGIAYRWGERTGIESLREIGAHRLNLYVGSLQSELRRYEYLPEIVGLNDDIASLLRDPANPGLARATNLFLERVSAQAKSSAIYVMDLNGLTITSSNWNQGASFVAMNFAFRPYFKDAAAGGKGRFYGIGTVSFEPGYYFANGIYRDGQMLGVAAVKVSLDKLEALWTQSAEPVVLVDESGVVILSSRGDWKFRTMELLSAETLAKLAETKQYATIGALRPVGFHPEQRLNETDSVLSLPPPGDAGSALPVHDRFLAQSRYVPDTKWRFVSLSPLAPVSARATNAAFATVLTMALLLSVVLFLQQRRRTIAQSLAARASLQRAHDELERKVHERTADLSLLNQSLEREIVDRRHAELVLKETMDELVQASKMAALGQMSTGISHELNQPLAALRTLSDNAIVYLNQQRFDVARGNLERISRLIDRIARITTQLKSFARKSPTQLKPVLVGNAISDVINLLEDRIGNSGVKVERSPAGEQALALCDENRLEQVLLNLMGNALDAMAQQPSKVMKIDVSRHDEMIAISIRDNGPGLGDRVIGRLFEPFFTTKEQGAGLGLGLVISSAIVRDFGGSLRGTNHPNGGAEFVVELRAAPTGAHGV
jgi:two-component system C4-dicarboxylate transport sensor histidine kinase DctB